MVEGDTISHYRILGPIGAGGMGVVCKAEDLLLNRVVAIKSLGKHLAADPASRLRLLQEARAASRLDHPNICRIHDVQELQDGQIVLVLSYYPGDPLSTIIARGPLEFERAVSFQTQLLSALEHAHANGIIHRDIKPSNVIVTPTEELKVVDFGLAKRNEANSQLTDTGVFMGTVSYMSPEQVLCEGVDHRADIWAAGVVFYEMLTGTLPFPGANPYSICDAVLRSEPIDPREHRPDLPGIVGPVIMRALARELPERYPSAADFRQALQQLSRSNSALETTIFIPAAPATTRQRDNSILVLPFTCAQSHTESDYFCDGLTDEIITGLTAVRALRTICSSSAFRLKGSTDSPQAIAEELRVRYLLKGTVWLSEHGNGARAIRVTAQLIDPKDDCVLWGSKYGGTLEDVFAIQENISRQIISALRLTLSPDEEKQIKARPLPEVHAYEYYLKAKHEILNYSREALERALDLLDKGERLVGKNALLLAAKGQVYWQFINGAISSDPEYLVKAKECGAQALALDPESSHAQRLLGLIAALEGDAQKAVRLLKRCITIDPNDSDSLSWYCALCSLSGKAYAAMPLARRIAEIDPLTPVYRFVPGLVSLMNGDFEEALPPFDDAIREDPENPVLLWTRGQVLAMNGRVEDATAQFHALRQLAPDHFFSQLGSFMAAALERDEAAAVALATPSLLQLSTDAHYAWAMAQGYALIGHTDQALERLETAMKSGFLNYPLVARLDPLLAPLRSDPRFRQFVQRMRERWEAFEVE